METTKKRVAILGSTGSIGNQTLDVIRQHRDMFEVELLVANNNYKQLAEQAVEFDANNVVICNTAHYDALQSLLSQTYTKVFSGIDSVCQLVTSDNIDIVLTAMVGFSGLRPTIEAIKSQKLIALANKETLVAGGSLITKLISENTPKSNPYQSQRPYGILPVDSEHSAIFQCLLGSTGNTIKKIHLTGSGGPFRTWTRDDISKASSKDALKHPRWNMGQKITIDSATLMNKGLEMIEAKWLFNIDPNNINIVIHPQSIIHSMIEYEDGAIIAQLGDTDMREPIQFALSFPQRLSLNNKKINFSELAQLTFEDVKYDNFPCLGLAFEAINKGGNIPCVMNAANEACVKAFLNNEIGFYDISNIIEKCMNHIDYVKNPSFDDIFESNNQGYILAERLIKKI